VMTNKFDKVSTPAAGKVKSKEATLSTPAPKDEPLTPVGKLIGAHAGTIKKEIGDYGVETRPDGSVRLIPKDKGKAHDAGMMAKLAMALGFNRHGKSPFKVRKSTGSQGGIVLFPESTSDTHADMVIAEIEDNEPMDYVDEAGLATMFANMMGKDTRRVPLTHVAKLPRGTEFEIKRSADPNTKSFWLRYRRTEKGLVLLAANGDAMTSPHREPSALDYVVGMIQQGATVRAPKHESVAEGVDKRDFAKGREHWQAYVNLNGYAFEPTGAGLKKLADETGVKKSELRRLIHVFLSA